MCSGQSCRAEAERMREGLRYERRWKQRQACHHGNFRKYGTVNCSVSAIIHRLAAMNA